MSHPGNDAGPTYQEETQAEPAVDTHLPVAVAIHGPVRIQDLPGVVAAIRTAVLPADNSAMNIANFDLRRKSLLITAIDQPVILGTTKSDVDGTAGAKFPINVPIVITGTTNIYAKSGTGGSLCTLSIIETDWTE